MSNYIEFNPNQKEEVRQSCGFENEKAINDAIDIFEEWIKKQNHFVSKDFERKYLEAFILAAKGSLEKAKSRLDKRCTFSTLMPEMYQNIDVNGFEDFHKSIKHFVLKTPCPDNYRVIYDVMNETHVDKFDLTTYIRYLVACTEYFLHKDYNKGYSEILDMSSIKTSSILMKFNPALIKKGALVNIEGYGNRMKHIHIVMSSKFAETLVNLIKQGLPQKIANRVVVHSSHNTLKDYFPTECLVNEYGGTGGTIDECFAAMYEVIKSPENIKILERAENYKTDESKRLSTKFTEEYLGVPGSFRSLTVD